MHGFRNTDHYHLVAGSREYLSALDQLDELAASGIEINFENADSSLRGNRVLSSIPRSIIERGFKPDIRSFEWYLKESATYGRVNPDSLDKFQVSRIFADHIFDEWVDVFQYGSLVVPNGTSFEEIYEKCKGENLGERIILTEEGILAEGLKGPGKPFTESRGGGTFQIRRPFREGFMPVYIEGTSSYKQDAARRIISIADEERWSLAGKSAAGGGILPYALFLSDKEMTPDLK